MEAQPPSKFTERLSFFLVAVAAAGAFLVLLDPHITISIGGQVFKIGNGGFSADLKGAVVSLILIGGFTAVTTYWLGSSDGSAQKGEAIARIAEGLPVEVKVAAVTEPVPVVVVPPDKGTS